MLCFPAGRHKPAGLTSDLNSDTINLENLNIFSQGVNVMLYNSRYRLTPQDDEIYCKRFKVSGTDVKGHHIYVYAECSKNQNRHADGGYYYLEIFFCADHYSDREFVVGLPFGYADMSKEEIEHEVSAYVRSQLDATFLGLVQNYLKKEHLMEEWLADQCPHES